MQLFSFLPSSAAASENASSLFFSFGLAQCFFLSKAESVLERKKFSGRQAVGTAGPVAHAPWDVREEKWKERETREGREESGENE
mmetsp:Transcript_8865/g.17324  ORF Transcript_8865/g.17324 Transcript_8865/m.17324 type:complete len:85 (+) Transcript_8865:739-993(+)